MCPRTQPGGLTCPGAVNKEARIVNGFGSVLAVIGWIGFVRVLALEIVMLVKLIDASEHPRAEVKPIALSRSSGLGCSP